MSDIPCQNRIICPPGNFDEDDPILNFSSEAVDGVNFTEMAWPITDFTNPFTPDDPNNPADTCDSPISQEEAELCALRVVTTDQNDNRGNFGGSKQLFASAGQTCAYNCPDGSAFFWTIPPGAFLDFSQSAADQRAKAYACKQVSLNAVCIKVDSTNACLGSNFLSVLTVDGGFSPYVIRMIAGTLPPGVGFVQDTSTTGFFSGVPSAPGIYSVAMGARDTHGNTISRTVTFTVLAISNANSIPTPSVGAFYNFQLQGIGGTAPYRFSGGAGLPGGVVLQSDGFIVGNPVAPIGNGFTAVVTDAAGNACQFALNYASGCSVFNGLLWANPPDSFSPPAGGNPYFFNQFFTPNSIEWSGGVAALGFPPTFILASSVSNVLTVPATGLSCKCTITVKSSSGNCAYSINVSDPTFATTYFIQTDVGNPIPLGTSVFTVTVPAGVPQIVVSLAAQFGNVFVSGALDIVFAFS